MAPGRERSWTGTKKLDACLERHRSGGPGAKDELLEAIRPRITQYIQRRLTRGGRRWAEIEDVVQDVLLEVAFGLEQLPVEAGADELLRRAQRTASLRVRDAVRRHRKLVGESALPGTASIARPAPSAGPITSEDQRRWIAELVARLPVKYATVVRLCAFEGLTCVEAATRLGIAPEAARKRYETARRELARRLGDTNRV